MEKDRKDEDEINPHLKGDLSNLIIKVDNKLKELEQGGKEDSRSFKDLESIIKEIKASRWNTNEILSEKTLDILNYDKRERAKEFQESIQPIEKSNLSSEVVYTENEAKLVASMPGVKEESIGIKFDENYVLIEGEDKEGRPCLIVERLENG